MILVKVYLAICNTVLSVLQFVLYKRVNNPTSIIIFRNGSMGDGLAAIPAILSIKKRFPDAALTLMTNTGRENLVSLAQLISSDIFKNVIDYQSKSLKETLALIKGQKATAVIQLPQNKAKFKNLIRDLLFFRVAGITSGFGWRKYDVPFLKQYQDSNRNFISERKRLVNIVNDNINIHTKQMDTYTLNIKESDHKRIEEIRVTNKLTSSFLVVVVGAKRPQNRWPIDYFDQIIESFIADFNYSVVLVGGPEDAAIADYLNNLDSCVNLIGKLTPIQSGVLMSHATVVLTNDTGPMHLAYCNGTNVIALFSSRDYKNIWFPPLDQNNVVFRTNDISCKLCLSETCANNLCMQEIKPENVYPRLTSYF